MNDWILYMIFVMCIYAPKLPTMDIVRSVGRHLISHHVLTTMMNLSTWRCSFACLACSIIINHSF